MIRPSTSGNTTCIARSAGDNPRSASSQASRVDVHEDLLTKAEEELAEPLAAHGAGRDHEHPQLGGRGGQALEDFS